MEKQVETKLNSQNSHWLDIAETTSVIVSVGGSVASIFFKEIFLASIPLSVCVALNLVNRNRIVGLTKTETQNAIAQLTEKTQDGQVQLSEQLAKLKQSNDNYIVMYQKDQDNVAQKISGLNTDFNKRTQELQEQEQKLNSKLEYLNQIETATRAIQASPNSAELYCQRGNSYKEMGKQQRAIEDYTKVIELDPSCAVAYHNRGLVNSALGNKKLAVDDLRKAAKYYFEKGDLDSYHITRNMSQALHELNYSSPEQNSERVLANSLFS